jgi:N-acetylneuraminic acid mutarotase
LFLPVNGSTWRDLGDAGKLPQGGRSNFGVAVAGGLVFMFGGSALNPSYVDCAVFNVSTMSWAATTPLPAPRAWMAVSTLSDNTILIIGGVDATFNFLSSVLQSSPVNGPFSLKWHDAPSLPFPRAFSGAGACRVEVFDIGGEGPEAGVNNSFYSL